MARVTIAPQMLRDNLPQTEHLDITDAHIDLMGHMNTTYYSIVFSRASRQMTNLAGVTADYVNTERKGAFMLKNFTQFINEVHLGESVTVYSRVIARGTRRVHYMHFMVNDTRDRLAATMEVLTTHADLEKRRSAPFPPHILANFDRYIEQQRGIDWSTAPTCGILKPD